MKILLSNLTMPPKRHLNASLPRIKEDEEIKKKYTKYRHNTSHIAIYYEQAVHQ